MLCAFPLGNQINFVRIMLIILDYKNFITLAKCQLNYSIYLNPLREIDEEPLFKLNQRTIELNYKMFDNLSQ